MKKEKNLKCNFCNNDYLYKVTCYPRKGTKFYGEVHEFRLCSQCSGLWHKVGGENVMEFGLWSREKLSKWLEANGEFKEECWAKNKFEQVSQIAKDHGVNFDLKIKCLNHGKSYVEKHRSPRLKVELKDSSEDKVVVKPIKTLTSFTENRNLKKR